MNSNLSGFYIPTRIDYRGRLYCDTTYLNYQSTELAKSLLLFANPSKLYKHDRQSIDYLKIYGANCFGLDKLSFDDRIKWIDENTDDILNFNNGKLLSKSEHKCLFLAFCFEYSKYIQTLDNDLEYFETFLPIQLDASCNGYQHISLLTNDKELQKLLNLDKSNYSDKPQDFYALLSLRVRNHLIDQLNNNNDLDDKTKDSYRRLINMDIKRSVIKKATMTIVYNVSFIQMVNYMQESFELLNDKFIYNHDESKALLKEDFYAIANSLLLVLKRDFPKLKELSDYLKEVANICYMLNIYIPWVLPNGLKVKQSYLDVDEVRIKPFQYLKNTFVLKIPNQNKYNKVKQRNAFLPNLIHSLDASALALLVNLYSSDISIEEKNIYTIHDCFGAPCSNMGKLVNLLKDVYVSVYLDANYLKELDSEIKNTIIKLCGDNSIIYDNNTKQYVVLLSDNSQYNFPNIDKVIGFGIPKNYTLKESSYILL